MKFANILFDGNRKGSINLGDDLQLVAVELLYKKMGLGKEDIIRIKLSELSTYDGEYCILPVSFPLYGYRDKLYITMFSPKIIPVFLALSIMSHNILPEEIEYLKHYEPIGCRDYHTVKILREKGILAYLNGCLTATLPKRMPVKGNKVYLVDIPEEYLQFIPSDKLLNAVNTSQVVDNCDNPEKEIENRLNEYAENASLVITTRLHCAMPCVAMGIPVVLMKDYYSFRFSFISRYIHIYEKDEFDRIDWNPIPVFYEDEKSKIMNLAIKRIQDSYNKYAPMFDLSWFYENNNIRNDYYIEHFDNVKEFIDNHFSKDEYFKYAIWGITQKADMICEYLKNNYCNSELVYVYDKNKIVTFYGIDSGNDINKLLNPEIFVFVTAATANLYAIDIFNKEGKTNFHISDDGIKRIGFHNA